MDAQHLSRLPAFVLIAGFAVLLLALPFSLPQIYQTSDPQARVQITEEHQTQWKIDQSLTALGFVTLTVGFAVFGMRLRQTGNSWVPILGAAALVVGTIIAALFIYRQTTDTLRAYQGAYSVMENLAYWLWLAGTLLFGVAILRADLPAWLGYAAIGATLVGILLIAIGMDFITPAFFVIFGLVIGIVSLRQ